MYNVCAIETWNGRLLGDAVVRIARNCAKNFVSGCALMVDGQIRQHAKFIIGV